MPADHDSGTCDDAGGGRRLNPQGSALRVLDQPGRELLEAIALAAQGTLGAAVFFGSRSSGVATDASSAYDLLLVCEDPRLFYRAVHRAGMLRRSPFVLDLVGRVLPPTQVRLARAEWLAKASVVSMAGLLRGTSPRRKDQFLAGRLFQDVHIVWARDAAFARHVEDAIRSARRISLSWVAPDLPDRFDSGAYVRQLFRTSFGFEIRPEKEGRFEALYAAQSAQLVPYFDEVLQGLVADGQLVRNADGSFSLSGPVPPGQRFRRRIFLEWSRVRATARWPKHAITFDGWLDYIVKKAERHSGEPIVLTPLERRLPLVFLWPRVFRFLARQKGKGRTV